MKLRSSGIAFKLFTLILILLTQFLYGCTGSGEKTDMSNLPKLINVSSSANINFREIAALGQIATFGDINNDNYIDFVAGNARSRPENTFLYLNNKDNTFLNVTTNSGLIKTRNRSATLADYNNDGLLDILIGTIQVSSPPVLYQNKGDLQFAYVSEEAGLNAKGGSAFQVLWLDYNNDGFVDILQVNVGGKIVPQHLYHNNGNGTFTLVSDSVGLTDSFNAHTGVAIDYDNDGDSDIFYGISGGINMFYRNNNGTFENVTESAGLQGDPEWDTVGACAGDFNGDGFMDIYIANISSDRNALYKNNGDGTFSDITETSSTQDVGDGRTCAFVDFNSDGKVDIYASNHINPSKLFVNIGQGKFKEVAEEVGIVNPRDIFSASWGDYNMDGYIDLLANGHLGGGLYKNSGNGNNNIVVNLMGNGTTTNTSAIGSRVTVTTKLGSQYKTVSGGKGCCEQDMLPLHFGLKKETEADILVSWTDGTECQAKKLAIEGSSYITVKQQGCDIKSSKIGN